MNNENFIKLEIFLQLIVIHFHTKNKNDFSVRKINIKIEHINST